MPTLLEKAITTRKHSRSSKIEDEMVELSLAWIRGEVSLTECSTVMGTHTGNTYVKLCRALREAYNQNLIELK